MKLIAQLSMIQIQLCAIVVMNLDPLFVKDTYLDSDMEQSNEQEQHSNESRYCICKEKVNTVTEN